VTEGEVAEADSSRSCRRVVDEHEPVRPRLCCALRSLPVTAHAGAAEQGEQVQLRQRQRDQHQRQTVPAGGRRTRRAGGGRGGQDSRGGLSAWIQSVRSADGMWTENAASDGGRAGRCHDEQTLPLDRRTIGGCLSLLQPVRLSLLLLLMTRGRGSSRQRGEEQAGRRKARHVRMVAVRRITLRDSNTCTCPHSVPDMKAHSRRKLMPRAQRACRRSDTDKAVGQQPSKSS
jgi:hypothetical protein